MYSMSTLDASYTVCKGNLTGNRFSFRKQYHWNEIENWNHCSYHYLPTYLSADALGLHLNYRLNNFSVDILKNFIFRIIRTGRALKLIQEYDLKGHLFNNSQTIKQCPNGKLMTTMWSRRMKVVIAGSDTNTLYEGKSAVVRIFSPKHSFQTAA